MKAFILAAGLGTRLKPFTEHGPKALVEVNGKPLLQRLIEKLKQSEYTDIVVNVHHFAEQVIDFLNTNQNFGINIHISDEREQLLDTGGAILKAQPFLEHSPYFLVHNVDVLSTMDFSKIAEHHKKTGALATMAVRDRNSDRKFLFDENLYLKGWQNTKTNEKILLPTSSEWLVPFAFSGIHIINSGIFRHIKQSGKFSIIETYLDLAKTFDICGFRHDEDLWLDVGKPEQLAQAQNLFK
ncbi:MAG: nucleotidyltransferase family protein [Bacteroidales bacterium]|jgi:NDP-sugar pyrophosphorylase family protein|nr:nucleotidyltransferase family protein [Bacteroidales bacterium]